jgi:phospholipid-translocating ATPase
MLPLVAILAITALKDGVEDYRRAKLDDEVHEALLADGGGPTHWLTLLRLAG